MIKNFYELRVWQDAHTLALDIYRETKKFPSDERFGLNSQIRRASASVAANIAEGFGRFHYKDKIKFYHQARGSVSELQNHILMSQDLGYLDIGIARRLFISSNVIIKELNGLIRTTGDKSSD